MTPPDGSAAAAAEVRRGKAHEWARRLIQSRRSLPLIFVASFLETIIVPIPIEVVLIPYMVARRDILWRIALITTLGCLAAAGVGYGVGYFLYESLGRMLIETLGIQSGFEEFRRLFNQHGFFAVLAIGVIPIPFQTAMLVAGMTGYSIPLFVLAATIARGIRYFGLALLVWRFGAHAESFYHRQSGRTMLLLAGAVLLIWALTVWLS